MKLDMKLDMKLVHCCSKRERERDLKEEETEELGGRTGRTGGNSRNEGIKAWKEERKEGGNWSY